MEENDDWSEESKEMGIDKPVEETSSEPHEEPVEKTEEKPKKFSLFRKKQAETPQETPRLEKPIEKNEEKIRKPLFKRKPKEPGEHGFIKKRTTQWKRTLEVAKKPTKEEFRKSAKVTGIGIAFLGLIGFIIFITYHIIVR